MKPLDYEELFHTALHNAIYWQNRCCDLTEIVEMFCLDAQEVTDRIDKTINETPECNPHPDAPHGFNRTGSHSLGRYVCDCEGWVL